jgi:hypothetical protein
MGRLSDRDEPADFVVGRAGSGQTTLSSLVHVQLWPPPYTGDLAPRYAASCCAWHARDLQYQGLTVRSRIC